MAIMGHSMGDDMNARYDMVEEADLIAAIDAVEAYIRTHTRSMSLVNILFTPAFTREVFETYIYYF